MLVNWCYLNYYWSQLVGHSYSNSLGMVTIRATRSVVGVTTCHDLVSIRSPNLRECCNADIHFWSSNDSRNRRSSSLQDRTLQAPSRRDLLRLTQADRCLVDDTSAPTRHTLPQSNPGRLPHVFLPVIKEWGSQRFCPNPIIR